MDAQNNEWQEPPIPERIHKEELPAEMSEPATLVNIYIEPGRTFEDLRRKPRFLMAWLLIIIAVTAFNGLFIQKIGFEKLVRDRIEASPQVSGMSEEQKQKIVEQQAGTVGKTLAYAAPPIAMVIIFLLGGLLYWLGANAMGGTAKFSQGLSVWVYSSFAPTVLFMIANIIVLMLKAAEDIDVKRAQSGVVQANPNLFIDTTSMPVLGALFSAIDLFAIWGWVLAAIGLQKVAKISSGAAWAVVLLLALVGITIRVVSALLFGG